MAMSQQLATLAKKFESEYASAKTANLKRYQQAMGMYDEIIEQYKPGGGFGAGFESQLESRKVKDVGTSMQQQISSGLFGVQSTGGIGRRWESEVGTPARLQLEDVRMGRYGEAITSKAGAIERREDEYPDSSLIANLYMQASQTGPVGSIPSSGINRSRLASTGMPSPVTGGPATPAQTRTTEPYSAYLARTAGTAKKTQAQAPTRPTYAPGGTTGRALKPTTSEQAQIDVRLKKMYPQMSKPGWGKTTTKRASPGPSYSPGLYR